MSKKKQVPSDIWAKGKTSGFIYHITEGTGDNLLEEDIKDGYVDYIYYDYYKGYNEILNDEAYDGCQYMLEEMYQSLTLDKILEKVANFENEEGFEVLETNDNRY